MAIVLIKKWGAHINALRGKGLPLELIEILEGLEEHEGIHAHTLAAQIDPTLDKIFAEEIVHIHDEQLRAEEAGSHTFAHNNRIMTRRQSRREAQSLMRRHR